MLPIVLKNSRASSPLTLTPHHQTVNHDGLAMPTGDKFETITNRETVPLSVQVYEVLSAIDSETPVHATSTQSNAPCLVSSTVNFSRTHTSMDRPYCNYCRRKGHITAHCWKRSCKSRHPAFPRFRWLYNLLLHAFSRFTTSTNHYVLTTSYPFKTRLLELRRALKPYPFDIRLTYYISNLQLRLVVAPSPFSSSVFYPLDSGLHQLFLILHTSPSDFHVFSQSRLLSSSFFLPDEATPPMRPTVPLK